MSKNAKHIVAHTRRWGPWLAWGAVVVILLLMRCGHPSTDGDQEQAGTSSIDTLQCINEPGLQRLDYRGFRVYYDNEMHVPACVTYEITPQEARGTLPRAQRWEEDNRASGCATFIDYVRSGYDRGHMAPAGDMRWDEQAMSESFMLTNVCPQNHRLNEGGWNRLEQKVRQWAKRDGNLIVITGPIFGSADTSTIGRSHVRVPGAFYKIVLAHQARPMRAIAFVYDNKPCEDRLSSYAVTVREIEQATGINFFDALPQQEQDRLETRVNLSPWIN